MRRSVWLWLASVLLVYATPCAAQQPVAATESLARRSASPPDSLAEVARTTGNAERRTARAQLDDGGFHPGDRITLWVNGEPTMSNTFTVRAGNLLVIPSLPEISLQGVHRSELRAVLLREISRYIRDPDIQVTTLVNVAVLGAVGRPGFFAVAPDAPITDVLMTAGGPSANSDFSRSRIMRDGGELADPSKVRKWLENNSTLEDMGIESGDQIIIGERTHRWQTVSAILGVTSLLSTTLLLLKR